MRDSRARSRALFFLFLFFSRLLALCFVRGFSNPDAKLESGLRRRIGCLRAQEPSARLLLSSRTAEGRRRRRRGISGAVWIPGSAGSRTSAGGRVSTSTFSAAARRLCFSGSRVRVEGFFVFVSLSLPLYLFIAPFFRCVFQRNQKNVQRGDPAFRAVREIFSKIFFFGWGRI